MGDSCCHTTQPRSSSSPIYVVVQNPEGDQATVYTDLLSGKKALLTSYLEFLNTFSHVYIANETNNNIISPGSGRKLCVHGVIITTESNAGDVAVDFASSNIPVARLYATRFQQHVSINLHIEGAISEPLTLNTTTGANDVFLAVSYIEET